nr:immunoglobulin heavy chain junction region [Mus musculus]MBK4197106.1 immunoglobulin heavy chain junction region [Mus musculus]
CARWGTTVVGKTAWFAYW